MFSMFWYRAWMRCCASNSTASRSPSSSSSPSPSSPSSSSETSSSSSTSAMSSTNWLRLASLFLDPAGCFLDFFFAGASSSDASSSSSSSATSSTNWLRFRDFLTCLSGLVAPPSLSGPSSSSLFSSSLFSSSSSLPETSASESLYSASASDPETSSSSSNSSAGRIFLDTALVNLPCVTRTMVTTTSRGPAGGTDHSRALGLIRACASGACLTDARCEPFEGDLGVTSAWRDDAVQQLRIATRKTTRG
mmetsp:Transcript_2498/g.8717  ORF Transcript_2498/g.8717 Transcript_2498/m.8717 type:complete len:249 (+) Transcript_2498:2860-3606(+)